MDLEKLRQDAQNQLDQKLAEVDRLAIVAKELEKKNVDAQIEHDKLVNALRGDIDSLRTDKAFAEEEIEKVKMVLKERQNEANDLRRAINVLAVESETTANLIEEKKRELAVVEQTGEKIIKAIEVKIAEKQREIELAGADFLTSAEMHNKELTSLNKAIEKARKELDEVTRSIEESNTNLSNIKEETKTVLHEAEQADHRVVLANEEAAKAGKELDLLVESIKSSEEELSLLRVEIETVRAELKPLLAKRIDSINYMKELEYKEANLRKKYEDVGLEYN